MCASIHSRCAGTFSLLFRQQFSVTHGQKSRITAGGVKYSTQFCLYFLLAIACTHMPYVHMCMYMDRDQTCVCAQTTVLAQNKIVCIASACILSHPILSQTDLHLSRYLRTTRVLLPRATACISTRCFLSDQLVNSCSLQVMSPSPC